ncbi:RagB/SusD family nutrient uptake outer membrane protein [Niastella populi]|uniref:Carbohydrate-binding protein SusD n=1 Tax=Niastella populi TaxID=550983 RepID=A0A1V9EPC0_9BACT|nr:RagB/SusD family nutrient uptake outer membrane protein [Niastella populi]OQP47882.1 hypothetical protein A4R26_31695 [Niastella populi]
MTRYQNLKAALIIAITFIAQTGCKKLVEADAPRTSLNQGNVYNTNEAAISVLTGLYQQMNQEGLLSGSNGISLTVGLSADEFDLSSAIAATDTKYYYYIDSLFSNINNSKGVEYWAPFYNYIFVCNSAIQGLTSSDGLSPSVKNQLLGEAKFIRAFLYFYLTNMYGDVPLVLTSDWKVSSSVGRVGKPQVYQQLITDLIEAENILSDKYLDGKLQPYTGSSERVRPTRWAAAALLARIYLYNGDWANAEAQASAVINNTSLYELTTLNNVFLKNSTEAIWQLQPILSGQNTADGMLFLLPSSGPNSDHPVYLSSHLLAAFEVNDQRRYGKNWIDSVIVGTSVYYYPYKYKAGFDGGISSVSDLKEYLMVLRLSEQYLIRAEARAQQNKIDDAHNDLNIIRNRSGLPNTTANVQSTTLTAILHERQVELFSEWGHRWFDLKRTGAIDAVMSIVRPQKASGALWKSYMQLYPILISDIQKNSQITQNPGY